MRLEDEQGLPVRTWTPATIVTASGRVHQGTLGRALADVRFYSDHTLELPAEERVQILLQPAGYRWRQIALDEPSATLDVRLTPISGPGPTLRVLAADGSPISGRWLGVGAPWGQFPPPTVVPLGVTDERGEHRTAVLPPGAYAFFVRGPASSEGDGKTGPRWLPLGRATVGASGSTCSLNLGE